MRRSGWGPWEKDLLSRHLADGPPVPSGPTSPRPSRRPSSSTALCCVNRTTPPRPRAPWSWRTRRTSISPLPPGRGPPSRLSDRVREQHTAVHALFDQGIGLRTIAPQLGLARNTVRRYANAASADELLVGRWTGRTSILDPYKPYLHQRWAEGCTVARHLFEEVRERGYPGGENVVKKYVAKLRENFPHDPPRKVPSVRNVTSWLTRHPDRLTDDQAQQLKAISSQASASATAPARSKATTTRSRC
jgi:hypothetical protein